MGLKMSMALAAVAGLSSVHAWAGSVAQTATIQPTAEVRLAADDQPVTGANADISGTVVLELGKAKKVAVGHRIKKANILSAEIADVTPLDPTNLLVSGKKPGTTQLIITDETDQSQVIDIIVQTDIVDLRKQLAELFPSTPIQAEDSAGTITLHGEVHDLQTAAEAAQLAAPYGKNVLNLLEVAGGQQVMLKVRFAEVSKQAEKELGFNFAGSDGVSTFGSNIGKNPFSLTATPLAGLSSLTAPGSLTSGALFGEGAIGKIAFEYFVDAMEQNSVLRMLAEPNLVTSSGQEATFLAGGSIPYPVPQGSGSGVTITIQWQDYGVNLRFTPIVLGDGRIRLKVAPEVSTLDYAHAIPIQGQLVPALTKRNVNTTVELAQGQSFAIAGLLQNTITASNTQFPLLGDIPVVGALFRSVQYQRNETELVVIVTPVLVHGMDPGDVTEVPGGKWREPNPVDFYALKDLGGEVATAQQTSPAGPAPRFHGDYGFQPAASAAALK
jgi:pilus assembly protein CpaC